MDSFKTLCVAAVAAGGFCVALAADDKKATLPDGFTRATKLIGANIENAKGDDHAEIVDLVLAPTHDEVRYALVHCEENDDRTYFVPLSSIRFEKDEDGECILRAESSQLTAMQSAERGDDAAIERVAAAEHANVSMASKVCRASKSIGTDVVDASGDELGEVEDFVVDTRTGNVAFAIVSMGGVLGIGEKSHVVPPAAFKEAAMKDGEARLRIDSTKELLASAPTCDKDGCPDPNDRALVARLNQIYGVGTAGREIDLIHTSSIVGADVRLRDHREDVGEVKDVTFDPKDGRLAFVIVELDDLPDDQDDCTVALPWQSVRFDPTTDSLTLNADAKRASHPDVRVGGIDDLRDPSVCARISRWFGVESPGSTADARKTDTTGPAMTATNSAIGSKSLLDMDVHDTTGADVGEIEDVAIEPGSGQLRYVAVLLDKGDDKLVALKWNELKMPAKSDKQQVTLLVDAPRIQADRVLPRRPVDERIEDRKDG